jgi:hypothetical protein
VNTTAATHAQRVQASLLLAVLFVAAFALAREGPYYDNVIGAGDLFMIAFFGGALVGYIGWIRLTGIVPELTFSGPHRYLWYAALTAALIVSSGASFVNRTFATPTGRTLIAAVESIDERRGGRWNLTVKMADGRYQRYVIDEQTAQALRPAKAVRLGIARGLLGYEIVAEFAAAE